VYADEELPLQVRRELRERLLARRLEIEQTSLSRVCEIENPGEVPDPEYAVGLEVAVSELVGFAIEAIGDAFPPPLPLALYPQARRAARNGVCLGTVGRRYLEGYLTLGEFIEQEEPDRAWFFIRYLGRLLCDLLGQVGEVYHLELERSRLASREERRVRLTEELLAGVPVDNSELAPGFDFDSSHIAVIAAGGGAVGTVGRLTEAVDRRLMQVRRSEDSVWAWFAGKARIESAELQLAAAERMPVDGCLALGEPATGLAGWRLSHRQAAAALRVGLHRGDRVVRYGEVLTEASLLHDPVRASSLRERYLIPLQDAPDGGEKSRRTLHAYFSRERNTEAAARALGIARQTVAQHLKVVEGRLGIDLRACAHDLEAALALDRLDRGESAPGPSANVAVFPTP
jgi:PucR C-terminal helix-turn-helix domain/GGDEF-like domain